MSGSACTRAASVAASFLVGRPWHSAHVRASPRCPTCVGRVSPHPGVPGRAASGKQLRVMHIGRRGGHRVNPLSPLSDAAIDAYVGFMPKYHCVALLHRCISVFTLAFRVLGRNQPHRMIEASCDGAGVHRKAVVFKARQSVQTTDRPGCAPPEDDGICIPWFRPGPVPAEVLPTKRLHGAQSSTPLAITAFGQFCVPGK